MVVVFVSILKILILYKLRLILKDTYSSDTTFLQNSIIVSNSASSMGGGEYYILLIGQFLRFY